ncbi:MAG: ABC transporter ATP-binding protein [Actinomycetota bacterium]|nr:ABC transporter ATP-binding protein [Actinomycetota bacterium]
MSDRSPTDSTPVLEFRNVDTHYGTVQILHDVSITIAPGELVCLLGGNASGKTTTLRTILGMVEPTAGAVLIDGQDMQGLTTAQRVAQGVSMVPENRRLFKRMSVRENLEIGAYLRKDDEKEADLEHIFTMFPRVKERLNQTSGTLSGGEQQMVAVGRALMSRPRVLLMDEPSMGLAPILVAQNFDIIEQINAAGTAVFVVEQNASMALSIADRGYVLQSGRIVLSDTAEALKADPRMREAYLGEIPDA